MVTCNVERFLAEAIESILGQTFTTFEFVIADFGSTDRTKALISKYAAKDDRIKFHEILPFGLVEARNTACCLAQGKYIAMMDADDVSLPSRLQREVEFAEQHPEVALLGGATEWIDAEGRPLEIHDFPSAECEIKTEDDDIKSELPTRCSYCHSTLLIRSDAFAFVGGYRPLFVQSEDYDLCLRISEHFKIANLKEVVLKYRIHSNQVSIRKRRDQTLCKLAAQVSAAARSNGYTDPLNALDEITSEALASMGVDQARQQNELALECRQWMRAMLAAGQPSAALKAACEILQSNLYLVDRRQIADLQITVSQVYWRQRKFLSSLLAAIRAVLARPMLVGRPVKPLLQRLRIVRE